MSWDWEKLKEQQHKRVDIPPQMDDLMKKFDNFNIPGGPILILLLIIGVLYFISMFYKVGVDEVAVVQRFGKYHRTESSGLHLRWTGMERVTKVKVKRVHREEFGFTSGVSNTKEYYSNDSENQNVSLMLTGDLNVALVPWIVQYEIKDPRNYLFKVQNIKQLIRDMSETTMRLVVGDRSINEVINKREELAIKAKSLLQEEMDKAESGINIVTVELKETNVPERVQSSFNEVNQATQEKEKLIYQAKEEYNRAIPAARGEAERTIKAAEGYALDRINRAKGETARFTDLYEEYVKAKDVTKRRIYLETMKEVYPRLGQKYIIDADQKNLLPLLNLEKQNGAEK
jgi:membrane protease subunit HflK